VVPPLCHVTAVSARSYRRVQTKKLSVQFRKYRKVVLEVPPAVLAEPPQYLVLHTVPHGNRSCNSLSSRGVTDNSLVRRSSPGVILTNPRATNGRSNRDNEVRSITRSSARSLTVIDPTETKVTSTGSWVDRRPDGFKASSYIWVMIRDIFRRFRQTQAATM